MWIYQVTPYYLNSNGGIVTVVSTLVKKISRDHQTVVIVTAEGGGTATPRSYNSEVHLVLPLPFGGRSKVKSWLGWFLKLTPTILRICRELRPHRGIMHLHFASASLHYFRIVRWISNINYVVTLHGSDVTTYESRTFLERFLIKFSLKGASQICAVSDRLAEMTEEAMPWLRGKVLAVNNGIDVDEQKTLLDHYVEWPDNVPRGNFFLCIGNLVDVKGHDVAIRAWKNVVAKSPAVSLVIAGGGTNHRKLEALASEIGCTDSVILLGSLGKEEIARLLNHSLGLILPSRNEGLGMVLLEAGVAGLPVIASRVGGIPEVIRDRETGILVPVEDPDAISHAVLELIQNRALGKKLAANLKGLVLAKFDARIMVNSYLSVYKNHS